MASEPSVSVIIPAYNSAGFIRCALDSALAQTHAPLEILVIDDGSLDATGQVVNSYGPPVRLLTQANAGPAAARNLGAAEARGEWLAFLDADDSWLPQKLERQLALGQDPSVGLIHCRHAQDGAEGPRPTAVTFEALWHRNRIITSTVLVRRKAFEEIGGFDPDFRLSEDYNLWLRVAASRWRIVTLEEQLCRYTPARGNLSQQLTRFADAELRNLTKVATQLGLSEEMLREREFAVFEEYSRHLFYERHLRDARRLAARTFRSKPSARRLGLWLATFVPAPLLDWRRRLMWDRSEGIGAAHWPRG